MTRKTYLFYDIESTGLNVAFDQVLQFAAIRTDENLNEIERHEIRIKLRPDITPSPYATLTHLITPTMMQEGELEVDGIRKIHALLNTPGTISLGYNTLGFDDEFLRFSFYRNLLTPYTHQYADNCSRMDIYPITILYYLYGNNEIKWPVINGKVSLKLENINAENNLAKGAAHDAIVDVEATLALAKCLAKNSTMWEYAQGYFNKQTDANRLRKINGDAIYLSGRLGYNNQFQAPVLNLGQHWHFKNQLIFLRLDLPELQQTNINEIDKTTWVFRKKLGEPGIVLPAAGRFLRHLDADRQAICSQNKAWLENNPTILQAIKDYYLDYKYPLVPEADVDSVLYQAGFLSNHDQWLCKSFHQAPLNEKIDLIKKFESPEQQELAVRLIGRNYPDALTGDYKKQYDDYLTNVFANTTFIDYKQQKKMSRLDALAEIEEIKKENLFTDKQDLLSEIETFYINHTTCESNHCHPREGGDL